jgi:hypothetical protein
MATIEDVGDVVDAFGSHGGVSGGRAQIDVPEASGDLVHGDAGLKAVRCPVGAQRVGMREALWDPGGVRVSADQAIDRLGGQRHGLLVRVATEAHEQRVAVAQRHPASQRMDLCPRFERVLHRLGHWNLALALALAADE